MNKTFDPFDELAAMFLTAPAEPSSATEVARPQCNGNGAGKPRCVAPVELLVAGHLPVRGGLWLTPYADAVARERGCAALIRLEHEESSLQVLGSKSDQIETGQDLMLRQAVAQVGMLFDHWIIRAAPGSNPIELLSANAEKL